MTGRGLGSLLMQAWYHVPWQRHKQRQPEHLSTGSMPQSTATGTPMASNNTTLLEMYETHARACDPNDFQAQVMRTPHGRSVGEDQLAMITEAILRGADIDASDSLLDLCCGNGAITDPIFARCQGGVGVDFTPYLIEVAIKHFQKLPNCRYLCSDAEVYVATTDEAAHFTKILFYGAFQCLPENKAHNILRTLRQRFVNVRRIFIGNLPDLDRAAVCYRDMQGDCPPLEQLKRHDTLFGTWRSEQEIGQLAADCGWRCNFSRMPSGYYAAHYRFDATLTPN
jgi:SAM-dependent methyltransferase